MGKCALKRRLWFCVCIALLAASLLWTGQASAQDQARKPNILVIMGDDVGWFNVGAYHRGMMSGKTPNRSEERRVGKEC